MVWTPTGVSHCPRESQDSSGWQEPQEVSGPTSVSEQGQTRVLKVLSRGVLKTSKRDCTTSVANLCHCLLLGWGNSFALYPVSSSLFHLGLQALSTHHVKNLDLLS